MIPEPRAMSRITCHVHHSISARITSRLGRHHPGTIYVDSARSVRRINRRRRFGLPGISARLEDAPTDKIQFLVEPEHAESVVQDLIHVGELDLPGHGSVYAQQILLYGDPQTETQVHDIGRSMTDGKTGTGPDLLQDLMLISCILSLPDSSRTIAALALDLGTSVPVVTFGAGTGLRDKLGLLRITVPAQKEIVQLIVPRHDTEGTIRLLIEQGRLNLPGRGFLYYTPISAGYLDTGLRVGPRDHAASIEQVIAAIDEIKGGTTWRRRFPTIDADSHDTSIAVARNNMELTVRCSEGSAGLLVDAALEEGARGATTSRARRLRENDTDGQSNAREVSVLTVPASISDSIVEAVLTRALETTDPSIQIETCHSPASFSRRARS